MKKDKCCGKWSKKGKLCKKCPLLKNLDEEELKKLKITIKKKKIKKD